MESSDIDVFDIFTNPTVNEPVQTPEPFWGRENMQGPAHVLKREEAVHRVICYLAAEGNTNREIADKTGLSPVTIAYVRHQPWAMQMIAKIIQEAGGKAVKNVLQGAALESAKTMITVMRGETSDARSCDRIRAAKEILDRLYGTAPALIMHGKVDANELSDEELAAAVNLTN